MIEGRIMERKEWRRCKNGREGRMVEVEVEEWWRGENGGGGIMVERGADGEGSR